MGAYYPLENAVFDKNESGQLMSRLTDDTKVINDFISQKLPGFFPAVITLIGSLIMLFVLDWQMTLLTFITIPIFILVIVPLGKIMQKYQRIRKLKLRILAGYSGVY